MASQLQHAGISVSSLDRAVSWYEKYFNFKEVKRFEKDSLEIRAALMQCGDGLLEILAPATPVQRQKGGAGLVEELRVCGANHFAVGVDNIEFLYENMQADNVALVTELMDGRLFFCKDPDGTLIEVRKL
jgi:catechol 2,3-dioxygenase-like lactoylglutathione lyase family enzyme